LPKFFTPQRHNDDRRSGKVPPRMRVNCSFFPCTLTNCDSPVTFSQLRFETKKWSTVTSSGWLVSRRARTDQPARHVIIETFSCRRYKCSGRRSWARASVVVPRSRSVAVGDGPRDWFAAEPARFEISRGPFAGRRGRPSFIPVRAAVPLACNPPSPPPSLPPRYTFRPCRYSTRRT